MRRTCAGSWPDWGFDEILLDNWAFPAGGEGILADDNYPAADGRTAVLEGLPGSGGGGPGRLSGGARLPGDHFGGRRRGGPRDRADRRPAGAGRPVLVSLGEGEILPQLDGPSVIPILLRRGRRRTAGPC